jgi:t-SNARE complex subunit (syntaxin)
MEAEMNANINVEEIKKDIEKYQKDLAAIQDEINKLEARKQDLLRMGYRLEGIIAYLNQKISSDVQG